MLWTSREEESSQGFKGSQAEHQQNVHCCSRYTLFLQQAPTFMSLYAFHTLPHIYKDGCNTCNTAHGSFIPFPAHAAKQVAVKNDAETNKASDELLESILAGDDDQPAPRAHRYKFSTSARGTSSF
jgi:hypothetical protein